MRLVVILVFILAFNCAFAGAVSRPMGKNCDLASPPNEAGEVAVHGSAIRVFPRLRDISATYSGCQAVWMPAENGWTLVTLTEVKNGDLIRIWSKNPSEPENCFYAKGRVTSGNASKCVAPEFLLQKSMPIGCVERIRQAVARDGLSAAHPKECIYE